MEAILTALETHWKLRNPVLTPVPSGHTNQTFWLESGARQLVVRCSWPGKSLAQIQREETVLQHLAAQADTPTVPRLRPTRHGDLHAALDDRRWLHLFERIPGEPGSAAGASDIGRRTLDALIALARLHAALKTLPGAPAEPADWLMQRFARVRARGMPRLPVVGLVDSARVLERVGDCIANAPRPGGESSQWLHGDYHLGNLQFVGDRIAGVVDFDDTGQGAASLEVAFALFALARDNDAEARFRFDADLWDQGLEAYRSVHGFSAATDLRTHQPALLRLFCADQVLIHLEAAQRGLWTLEPGIGFIPCWNTLIDP